MCLLALRLDGSGLGTILFATTKMIPGHAWLSKREILRLAFDTLLKETKHRGGAIEFGWAEIEHVALRIPQTH